MTPTDQQIASLAQRLARALEHGDGAHLAHLEARTLGAVGQAGATVRALVRCARALNRFSRASVIDDEEFEFHAPTDR